MTPEDRSHEVSRIYLAALELPGSDRLAYVQRECDGDEALQRELESLLAWNSDVEPVVAALVRDAIAAAADRRRRQHHAGPGGADSPGYRRSRPVMNDSQRAPSSPVASASSRRSAGAGWARSTAPMIWSWANP